MRRRLFLAGGAGALAGCASVTNALNENNAVKTVVYSTEALDHFVIGTHGMAKIYPESMVDRDFRVNGFLTPRDSEYTRLVSQKFAPYVLPVTGAIERPQRFALRELRAIADIAQATRHDCVEGWSAIGKFSGVRLSTLLGIVMPAERARYVVFYCFDRSQDGVQYYESLDLKQAAHPQTQLALDLNDAPIDPDHGGPVRLKVPTQLGYKSAKWVQRIELVASLKEIGDGNGGYWEDQGYEWYAGI